MRTLIFLASVSLIFLLLETFLLLIHTHQLKNLLKKLQEIIQADSLEFSKMVQFILVIQLLMVPALMEEIVYSKKRIL